MKDKTPSAKELVDSLNKKTLKKKTKFASISQLVISTFKSAPEIKSKEMIMKVIKFFPTSKFNVYHYSWYKYQIKKDTGKYHKLFDTGQLKAIFG